MKEPVVEEFYTVWREAKAKSNGEKPALDSIKPSDRHIVRAQMANAQDTAHVVRLWFQALTEEDQMTIVRASMNDSVLYRNLFFYFTDIQKTYRTLIS